MENFCEIKGFGIGQPNSIKLCDTLPLLAVL